MPSLAVRATVQCGSWGVGVITGACLILRLRGEELGPFQEDISPLTLRNRQNALSAGCVPDPLLST